ncbi:uncharacterized protein B0I36DRAFT_350811 [Microdochium trichocladiopsis]|uniref:Uncharacterized protein n=1 Tax=Microdochium trichocladiopsis TaxID=1682393 RepID=A0A9P9BKP0_9PEZI|nr:uncharacterized protein B0I36DRAFT_350811 [Microdochium trichocladiopsis]KAH7027247.1 hypothetical protein B0I36DRAFT_350811 [Microdochium trichocladiopsis]
MIDRAERNCKQRGPARAASSDSSDESDGDEPSESDGAFTPAGSTDVSSKAQTPMSSIENDNDSMVHDENDSSVQQMLQMQHPRQLQDELHRYEKFFREQCAQDRKQGGSSDASHSFPVEANDRLACQPQTPSSQRVTTRSETGLFVTQSPNTPAKSSYSSRSRRSAKSPASALNQQVSHLSLSAEPDGGTSKSASSEQKKNSRRKQKERRRLRRSLQARTPCPADRSEDAEPDMGSSVAPITPAASTVLGYDPADARAEESSPAYGGESSSEAMPRTPDHQETTFNTASRSPSDDPFATPYFPNQSSGAVGQKDGCRLEQGRSTTSEVSRALPGTGAQLSILLDQENQKRRRESQGPEAGPQHQQNSPKDNPGQWTPPMTRARSNGRAGDRSVEARRQESGSPSARGKPANSDRIGSRRSNADRRGSRSRGTSSSSPSQRRSPIHRQQQPPPIRRWDQRNSRPSAARDTQKQTQSSPARPLRHPLPPRPPPPAPTHRGETAPPFGRNHRTRRLDTPVLQALSDEQHDERISSRLEELHQEITALKNKVARKAARKSMGSDSRRR